jgi:D-inositol-3-phosphate glycosyltransferase
MKCIVFRYLPPPVETPTSIASGVSIMGENVVVFDLTKTLLEHGTYDRYIFLINDPGLLEKARADISMYACKERAELLLLEDSTKLRQYDDVILFSPDITMHAPLRLRQYIGRPDWPVVGITHSISGIDGPQFALSLLLNQLFDHDALICTSAIGKTVVSRVIERVSTYLNENWFKQSSSFRARLPIIPLCVDTDYLRPQSRSQARSALGIPDDACVFINIGRFSLDFKADPYVLMLAFSQFIDNYHQPAILILAGDDTQDSMAGRMLEFAVNLGIGDKVRVMPNIDRETKLNLYGSADASISLSDNVQETFGLVPVEAMACGVPVIVSDWNGYRETVKQGETGFLVSTRWTKCIDEISRLAVLRGNNLTHRMLAQAVSVDTEQLLDRMHTIARNVSLRQTIGENARNHVLKQYNRLVIIKRYEDLWNELLDASSRKEALRTKCVGHGVLSYDYLEVFSHYATAVVDENVVVGLTPFGDRFRTGKLPITLLPKDIPGYKPSIAEKLLNASHYVGPASVAQLIENINGDTSLPLEVLMLHIGRLLKYGLLMADEISQ